MLGIFAIICLTSYILFNIIINHSIYRDSDKKVQLAPEPRRYETCTRATPLIVASLIVLLIGWIGCFWPYFFIEGLKRADFIGVVILGIAPIAAICFAIYSILTCGIEFISISNDKIEYCKKRKQFSVEVSDINKISYPGLGTYRIHLKEKNAKNLQFCINRFNNQKEIISLMKQFREHVAKVNNLQNSFAHKFSPWGTEMFLGKIYMPLVRFVVVLALIYTSWCSVDYDFFKKDYTKLYNNLGAVSGQSENAWDYYVKAVLEYSVIDEDLQTTIDEQIGTGQLNLDKQQIQMLNNWYRTNTTAIANLKKAAAIDYCNAYYENISFNNSSDKSDFSSPSDAGYRHIKNLYTNLNACRLLSINHSEWTDLFEIQLASARHFTNGKGVIDQLVGYAILGRSVKLISSNQIKEDNLEKIRLSLTKYFPDGIDPISVEGELLINCAKYESFINTSKIPVQTPLNPKYLMCGPISGFEKNVRYNYAKLIDQAAKGIEVEEKEPSFFSFPILRNLFLTVADPAISKCYKLSKRADVCLSAAYIAIDLEKYKLENGKYPSELTDLPLASKVPTDPFSDDDILYRLDENKAVLYSVGPNGKDDGGHRDKNKINRKRDDIIYWERSF